MERFNFKAAWGHGAARVLPSAEFLRIAALRVAAEARMVTAKASLRLLLGLPAPLSKQPVGRPTTGKIEKD